LITEIGSKVIEAQRRCDQGLLELVQDIVDALDCVTDVEQFTKDDSPQSDALTCALGALQELVVTASNEILRSASGMN
jgi:hypothetical protein